MNTTLQSELHKAAAKAILESMSGSLSIDQIRALAEDFKLRMIEVNAEASVKMFSLQS